MVSLSLNGTEVAAVGEVEKQPMAEREPDEKVWQQTPERETAEKVWQQPLERAAVEQVGWQPTPEREPAEKVCGSHHQSASPSTRCVAANAGARGHREGGVAANARARACRVGGWQPTPERATAKEG